MTVIICRDINFYQSILLRGRQNLKVIKRSIYNSDQFTQAALQTLSHTANIQLICSETVHCVAEMAADVYTTELQSLSLPAVNGR